MSCLRCTALQRQLEEQTAQLRELAIRDELTGLYNRRGFFAVADQYLIHANRAGESALLCYFDIDGLKTVNDTHGHKAGDAMICKAADALRAAFRAEDIIARIGGDEFVALAIDTTNAQGVLKRLGGALISSSVALSCGAVEVTRSSETLRDMLVRADAEMYAQKRERKAG